MPYKTSSTASWKVQKLRESVGSRSSQLKIYDRSSKDRGIVIGHSQRLPLQKYGLELVRMLPEYTLPSSAEWSHTRFATWYDRMHIHIYIYICISIYAHVAMKTYRSLAELDVEKQMCTLSRPEQATTLENK